LAHTTTQVGLPTRHGAGWLVPSLTTEGTAYFVDATARRCTCKGFSYRGRCVHLGAVIRVLLAQDEGDVS
jgi:hypothetical protein